MLFMAILTVLILIAIITTCYCDKKRPSANKARYGESFANGKNAKTAKVNSAIPLDNDNDDSTAGASENLINDDPEVKGPVAINSGSDGEQEEEIVNVSGSVQDDSE